jgi:hypothetical protein
MATLTATQMAYIRENAGDAGTTLKLVDETLQVIYDDAEQGNGDLDRTVYFAIRRLYAIAVREFTSVSSPVTGMAVARSPFAHYERLLALWGNITGIDSALGRLSVGSIDYALDYEDA